jgi:hypothetical protein
MCRHINKFILHTEAVSIAVLICQTESWKLGLDFCEHSPYDKEFNLKPTIMFHCAMQKQKVFYYKVRNCTFFIIRIP